MIYTISNEDIINALMEVIDSEDVKKDDLKRTCLICALERVEELETAREIIKDFKERSADRYHNEKAKEKEKFNDSKKEERIKDNVTFDDMEETLRNSMFDDEDEFKRKCFFKAWKQICDLKTLQTDIKNLIDDMQYSHNDTKTEEKE